MVKSFRLGVLPGDYIGPEIIAQALKVLGAVEKRFDLSVECVHLEASGEAFDKYGEHLPASTLATARTCDALLKGPFGGPPEELHHPKWSGVEEHAILGLRKHLGLYANLRPIRVFEPLLNLSPLRARVVKGADFVIVRELVSGIYFGDKGYDRAAAAGEREAYDTETYREPEIVRIARTAFELARTRRGRVTLVGKSNVLRSSVLWRDVVGELASEYAGVELDYMHVDNAAMQLIIKPSQFDVMLTSNLFGDILSDEASAITGSIGLLPSASVAGGSFGLYEPIHGSAPAIAGQDIANPLSAILCLPLMLRHSFGLVDEADAIDRAVDAFFAAGHRTADLGARKPVGTARAGDLIAEAILEWEAP
jgi:3-isopropylmalate dehydrogenase